MKVVAAIRDVPLWEVVTAALEDHLAGFEQRHGRLPALEDTPNRRKE